MDTRVKIKMGGFKSSKLINYIISLKNKKYFKILVGLKNFNILANFLNCLHNKLNTIKIFDNKDF